MTQNTVWGNIAWDAYAGGTLAEQSTSLQVALLGFGRTAISRVQLRKYFGVFTERDMTSGAWLANVRGACDDLMVDHVQEQVMAGGLALQGCAYRLSDGRVTLATSVSTSEQPVIQRRRRRGRGS